VFLSAPIHHHLEAIGWPETKVTMRFWLLGQIFGFVGLLLALAGGVIS
jgi:phospho-N-acetylmuramoyl-pentapeptide-transferase